MNNYFAGLTIEEAGNLSSYRHFRPSNEATKIDMLSKKDRTEILNFFDGLDRDVSYGSWSVKVLDGGLNCFVRNAKWPGFVGYNRVNSGTYGYAYFGEGRKLDDIHFLV